MQQISKILVLMLAILCLVSTGVNAQHKKRKKIYQPAKPAGNLEMALFAKEAENAGVNFTLPASFKQIPAVNNDNFSFDYAMTIPGQSFEIWLQVHSLKQNWSSYEQVKNITGKTLANPDSIYLNAAQAHVAALSDDSKFFSRPLPPMVLEQYNADAGRTYFFSLANLPETKQYKYALLIALQKNHSGYLMAVCLTNEKGPEFFKNINKARDCIKFK